MIEKNIGPIPGFIEHYALKKMNESSKHFIVICPFCEDKSGHCYIPKLRPVFSCRRCKTEGHLNEIAKHFGGRVFIDKNLILQDMSGSLSKLAHKVKSDSVPVMQANYTEAEKEANETLTAKDLEIYTAFCELAHQQIWKSPAYPYLKTRGISDEAIRHFKLGGIHSTAELLKALLKQFSKAELIASKILKECVKKTCEIGEMLYFSPNFLIIPYFDEGRVLMINGRVIHRRGNQSKYFKLKKGSSAMLFNTDAIRYEQNIHLVEGEMNCISMWQMGITNVASFGSVTFSYKKEVLELITGKSLTIFFDKDYFDVYAKGSRYISDFSESIGYWIKKADQWWIVEKKVDGSQYYDINDWLIQGKTKDHIAQYILRHKREIVLDEMQDIKEKMVKALEAELEIHDNLFDIGMKSEENDNVSFSGRGAGTAVIIRSPMSTGKTYNTVETLNRLKNTTAVIFVKTNREIYEIMKQLDPTEAMVVEGVTEKTCINSKDIFELYKKNYHSKQAICSSCENRKTCPILRQYDEMPNARILIATHRQYLNFINNPQRWRVMDTRTKTMRSRDVVIVDEDLTEDMCGHITMSVAEFEQVLDQIKASGIDKPDMESMRATITQLVADVKESTTFPPLNRNFKVSKEEKEKWGQYYVNTILKEHKGTTNNYFDEIVWMIAHGFRIDAGFRREVPKIVVMSPPTLNLSVAPKHIFLDATPPDRKLFKKIFPFREIKEIDIKPPKYIKNLKYVQIPISDLAMHKVEENIPMIEDMLKSILAHHKNAGHFFIVTKKSYRDAVENILKNFGLYLKDEKADSQFYSIAHYGNQRGSNEHKGAGVGILLGTPLRGDEQIMPVFSDSLQCPVSDAEMYQWENGWKKFKTEFGNIGEFHETTIRSEIMQSIGRLRSIRNKEREFYFYSLTRAELPEDDLQYVGGVLDNPPFIKEFVQRYGWKIRNENNPLTIDNVFKTGSRDKIVQDTSTNGLIRGAVARANDIFKVAEIIDLLNGKISRKTVHKHLTTMVEEGVITFAGKSYSKINQSAVQSEPATPKEMPKKIVKQKGVVAESVSELVRLAVEKVKDRFKTGEMIDILNGEISRKTIHKHLTRMVDEGVLAIDGNFYVKTSINKTNNDS